MRLTFPFPYFISILTLGFLVAWLLAVTLTNVAKNTATLGNQATTTTTWSDISKS